MALVRQQRNNVIYEMCDDRAITASKQRSQQYILAGGRW